MGKHIDLTGKKYGRLTVIRYEGKSKWLCQCECGNTKSVATNSLNRGLTKSCGCIVHEMMIEKQTKHGLVHTRLNRLYHSMKSRCSNPNEDSYKHYGGKNIGICSEWENDFKSFYDWAINNGYKDGLSIDRIDNSKGYSPDNCRWVTMKTQQNNRTNNHLIEFNGEIHTLQEWSEITDISHATILKRLKNGWSIERTLSEPVNTKYRNIT